MKTNHWNNKLNKIASTAVLLSYGFSILLYPIQAQAVIVTADPNAKPNVQCDDFCKAFKADAFGQYFSASTWSMEDNQLCADAGAPVTSNSAAMPTPFIDENGAAAAPLACSSGPVVYTARIKGALQELETDLKGQRCVGVSMISNRCKWHNSSVERYCMALRAIDGEKTSAVVWDSILMALDGTTAAVCGAACASGEFALMGACSKAAVVEGLHEMAASLAQMSSPLQQSINSAQTNIGMMTTGTALLGGVGAAGGVAVGVTRRMAKQGMKASAQSIADEAKRSAQQGVEDAQRNFDRRGMTDAQRKVAELDDARTNATRALDDADDRATRGGSLEKGKMGHEEARKKAQQASCASAAIFAILFGVRTYSLTQAINAKREICKDINDHLTSTPVATTTSGTTTAAAGGGSAAPGAIGSGTTSTLSGTTSSQPGIEAAQNVMNCVQTSHSLSACTPNSQTNSGSTAADEKAFREAPDLGPIAEKSPKIGELAEKATSEGAGEAMKAMLGGEGKGVGAALANLAQTAQSEGAKLAGAAGLASSSVYSGGGGGSPEGSKGGGADLLGSLMGGGSGGAAALPEAATSFGNTSKEPPDIWHTNSNLTIFDIVSEKVGQSTYRVQGPASP